jgi:hypothetical protein
MSLTPYRISIKRVDCPIPVVDSDGTRTGEVFPHWRYEITCDEIGMSASGGTVGDAIATLAEAAAAHVRREIISQAVGIVVESADQCRG